jgi:hypothetical protein
MDGNERRRSEVKIRREKIIRQLREMGRDEDADRAERILPEKIDPEKDEGTLRSLGLDKRYAPGGNFPPGGDGFGGDAGGFG